LRVDDEARAETLRLVGSPGLPEELLEWLEELVERITLAARSTGSTRTTRQPEAGAPLHLLRAGDIDDRGREALGKSGEVGQSHRGRRDRRPGLLGRLLPAAEPVDRLAR